MKSKIIDNRKYGDKCFSKTNGTRDGRREKGDEKTKLCYVQVQISPGNVIVMDCKNILKQVKTKTLKIKSDSILQMEISCPVILSQPSVKIHHFTQTSCLLVLKNYSWRKY